MNDCDVLVVGAGMAGAAAAYHLAERVRVIVVEREDAPGYHSTGRSAAMFTETYGPQPIRLLTGASGPFLRSPPPGFAEVPLLRPRGVLFVARPDQIAVLDGHEDAARATGANVERLDVDVCCASRPCCDVTTWAAACSNPTRATSTSTPCTKGSCAASASVAAAW